MQGEGDKVYYMQESCLVALTGISGLSRIPGQTRYLNSYRETLVSILHAHKWLFC